MFDFLDLFRKRKVNDNPPEYLVKSFERFRKQELQEFMYYLKTPWHIIWINFLVGTARGLGLLLGAAIVIALGGYVLKEFLSNIPFVGEFFQALDHWIQETLQSRNVPQ